MALRIGPTCGGRRTTRVGGRARSLLPWGPACTKVSAVGPEVRVRDSRETRWLRLGARNLWQSPRRDLAPLRAGVGPRSGETWPRRRRLRGKDSKRSVVNARRRGSHHGTTKKSSFSVPARPARYQSFSPRAAATCATARHRRAGFDSRDHGRGQRKVPLKTVGCGFKRLLVPAGKTGPRSPRVGRGHTQRET